jgi:hypothetical protein
MTEPTDETQTGYTPPDRTPARDPSTGETPGVVLPPPGPPAGPPPAGQTPSTSAPPLVPGPTAPPAPDPARPDGSYPLRADPNRPAASEWREPPWFPPRDRPVKRGPNIATVVIGLVLVAIGLYYLLDVTLGVDLPPIRWGSVWPIILIVIGGLVILRASSRR